MLELLISILISLNIHFTVIDNQVQITSEDMRILQESPLFQGSRIDSSSITVTDEVDPSGSSDQKN